MRRQSVLRTAAVCLGLVLCGVVAGAAWAKTKKKPSEKYFVSVVGVEVEKGVPDGAAEKIKTTFAQILAKRSEFVSSLEGAPDPAVSAAKFRAWMKKKKLRAFDVTIKVTAWEREVLPPKEGKTGQILKQHVAVSLLGTSPPDNTLSITGDGMATIAAEVGKNIRPKDEEYVIGSALDTALGQAVENAIERLAAGPPAKPMNEGKRRK